MNDFTKEELQMIQWEINTVINKLNMTTLSSEKHSALNEKIQSMIENYDDDKKVKDSLNYIVLKAREWKLKL